MGWDTVLLNRPHGIIPESAIGSVYSQTGREYEVVLRSGAETALHLAEDLGGRICSQGKDTGEEKPGGRKVIVIDTQGYEQEDTVAVSDVARGETTSAYDCLGYRFPVQYTGEDTLISHAKGIPPYGCAVCSLMGAEDSGRSGPVAEHSEYAVKHSRCAAECPEPWSGFLENDWYRAKLDDKTESVSLVEKGTGGQLLKEGHVGDQFLTFRDCPMDWDNWDADIYYQRKPYHVELVTVPILEEWGPVRAVVFISRRFAGSLVEQDIVFYPDLPRIDFVTRADWRGHHALLGVYFPAQVNVAKATYEIQFGNAERETISNHSWGMAKFEVCACKWADLSENGLGFSLLNDCKYGCSIRGGKMGLTLIKSGACLGENADIGVYEFTYSIYPHKGRWQEARTVGMAYGLNSPLVSALAPAEGPGGLRNKVSVDQPCRFVGMTKKTKDGNGYILRVHESRNTRASMTVGLGFGISHVEECDLLERTLRSIETDEHRFKDFIKPYEIKTYRVSHAGM